MTCDDWVACDEWTTCDFSWFARFFYPHNDEEPQPANPPRAPGSTAELCPIFGEASPRACGEWMTCDDWMTCDEWVACDDWMTCGEWLTRGE